jgi:hypothetical protein
MNAQAKPKDWIDPVKEAEAVKALRESLKTMLGGEEPDEQLFADSIEGETSLFELIDQLLHRRSVNLALADGVDRLANDLDARRTRFLQRAEADKALIEQAMMIAELPKVERPGATLSLTARAPKLMVTDEADIPAQFWKPAAPSLDKKALTDALKAGETVTGACLSNAAPTLTVRTK